MTEEHLSFNDMVHRTGLNPVTIHHFEGLGLLGSWHRATGAAYLYTEKDARHLELLRDMQSLNFSDHEKQRLLITLEEISESTSSDRKLLALERLATYQESVQRRLVSLLDKVTAGERFAVTLTSFLMTSRHARRAADHAQMAGDTCACSESERPPHDETAPQGQADGD